MLLFQSCEKDELPQIESETVIFPKLSGSIISVEDLLNKPDLHNKILSLSKDSFRKTNGSNQIQIDTTHIEVIESDQFTAYTFAIVQDSIEKQSILRNYMLTIVSDSLLVQSLVSYPVLADKQLDMQNIQFEQVWGDSLITQTRFKCGGTQTTWYSYEDCYEVRCGLRGNHGPGEPCDDGTQRGGVNCVTRWASFTYQESPCETIDAGSSPGGGGGSGGGGNTNPPRNNPPIDLVIPISPVGELNPVNNQISRIDDQLNLTPQQVIFLNQPENEHITEAVDEYLDEQALTINEEGKQALRDVIDVFSGEKDIDDLVTILANRLYNNILGKSLLSLPSGQFDDIAGSMQNLDPHDNLNLADWKNVSQRNKENYSIISGVIGNSVWSSLTGSELAFTQAQQDTITQNALFSGMLSELKEIIENTVPQTAEEWEALFQILKPVILESLIEFIPGGGIAIAINDIVNEMSATPADYTVITIAVVSIVAEFVPWAKIGKATAKTFKNLTKGFRIFKRVEKFLPMLRRANNKGFKTKIDGDDIIISGAPNTPGSLQIEADRLKIKDDGSIEIIDDLGETILEPKIFKKLNGLNVVNSSPGGFINRTNINNNSLKIKIDNPSKQADINAIKNGQDNTGSLSERLVDDIFANDGYEAVDPNVLGVPSTQGFDNVLIKRDAAGNIEDVIINESKQLNSPTAGFQLGDIQGSNNSACQGAGGCIQMSDNWIDDVLTRMQNGNGPQAQLAADLRGFMNTNQLTLTTSGVDRVTGELNIVRINNF